MPQRPIARRVRLWRALALVCALLLTAWTVPSHAQAEGSAAEYQIKAAFLHKFFHFVEWPPQVLGQAPAPLRVGVLGADALADELSQVVAARPIAGRPIVVQKLQAGAALSDLHVLFVGRSQSARMPQISAALKNQPLLLVSESDDAFAGGSAINFVVVEDKVRFDVALYRAEQLGLKISARLLTAARKVVASL
jgi:YfiR/HmsC-like